MNYDKIYDLLMSMAKMREIYYPLIGYSEEHHILPKCIFPELADFKKYPENKAVLTAREHYLAHLLLVKMERYKTHALHFKLILGAHMMCVDGNGERVNNRRYEWLKKLINAAKIKNQKGKKLNPKSVEKREATRKRNSQKPGFVHHLVGRSPPNKGKKGPKQSPDFAKRRIAASLKAKRPKILKNAFKKCALKLLKPSFWHLPQLKEREKKRVESMLKTIRAKDYIDPRKGISTHNKGKQLIILTTGQRKYVSKS